MAANSRPTGSSILDRVTGTAHHSGRNHAEVLTPHEAANIMLECIYEFNACVPYSGLSSDVSVDQQALASVLALLPEDIQPGFPPPALGPDDTKQVRLGQHTHARDTYGTAGCGLHQGGAAAIDDCVHCCGLCQGSLLCYTLEYPADWLKVGG